MAARILSDPQWFGILDRLLNSAIETLILDTRMTDHYVSQLVNYQLAHKKRHVGGDTVWTNNISRMLSFLSAPSIETFEAIGFDRGYVFNMLKDFLGLVDGYEAEYERAFHANTVADLNSFNRRIGASRDPLLTIQTVRVYLQAAREVKHGIIAQYDQRVESAAVFDAKHHPLVSDSKDLRQGYYLAANRAVDHFNVQKGAFKTYLDQWIKKSRNGDHHHYGSAFQVPAGATANHLYVPLDGVDGVVESAFDLVNSMGETQRLLDLIAMVDPGGYAAQALEIGTEKQHEARLW